MEPLLTRYLTLYNEPITITLSIPGSHARRGTAFRNRFTACFTAARAILPLLSNLNAPLDLTDYTLSVPDGLVIVNASVVNSNGDSLPVPDSSGVVINSLLFNFAGGYLGQEFYTGERDTIAVNFFRQYAEGEINLVDPSVTIRLNQLLWLTGAGGGRPLST